MFFFFLRFYCFSKDIGFHKKTRTKPRENKKSPFHTIARTKADKKSCSDSLECEYHLNKLKVGKVWLEFCFILNLISLKSIKASELIKVGPGDTKHTIGMSKTVMKVMNLCIPCFLGFSYESWVRCMKPHEHEHLSAPLSKFFHDELSVVVCGLPSFPHPEGNVNFAVLLKVWAVLC